MITFFLFSNNVIAITLTIITTN